MDFGFLSSCYGPDGVAKASCLPQLLVAVINAAFLFSGSVAVAMIIYAGIKYIMSSGDTKQIEEGKKILTYSTLGLILVLFAALIVNVLSYITRVSCIQYGSGFIGGFGNCQ